MRNAIAVAVICFGTWLALAQTQTAKPLNANTGLWQITQTVTWTGLPPQYAAMMKNGQPRKYNSCVKAKDLSSNPWAEPGEHCAWTVLKSDGTNMEVQGSSCQKGNGATADVHGTVYMSDSQDGTGTFDITLNTNGQTMKGHATFTGKWLSATCTD
jgi:hypothetical protein